jgi:ribose-phosphate pyrophosphokinase
MRELEAPLGRALVGEWKNGETRVKLDENVRGSDVFVIQSICNPVDHHLMELLLMIDALRRASAARITAVIPYYGYAKQEKKTSGREPISAKLVANLIVTAGANRVLTIDLHAPAIEGFFDIPVDHLRATPLLARHFKRATIEPTGVVAVSPDAGGVGRAEDFRVRVGGTLAIISKRHPVPDATETLEMVGDVAGRAAVIVDDMVSTGGTLTTAAELLQERGAATVHAAATHGIFAADALELIERSPIERVLVTDTVPVPEVGPRGKIDVITVAPLLAEAIMRIHKDLSISALFT